MCHWNTSVQSAAHLQLVQKVCFFLIFFLLEVLFLSRKVCFIDRSLLCIVNFHVVCSWRGKLGLLNWKSFLESCTQSSHAFIAHHATKFHCTKPAVSYRVVVCSTKLVNTNSRCFLQRNSNCIILCTWCIVKLRTSRKW